MLEQLRDGRYQKCVGASSKIGPAPLTTAQTVCQKNAWSLGLTASKNLPKNLQTVLEFEVCNLIMTLTQYNLKRVDRNLRNLTCNCGISEVYPKDTKLSIIIS